MAELEFHTSIGILSMDFQHHDELEAAEICASMVASNWKSLPLSDNRSRVILMVQFS